MTRRRKTKELEIFQTLTYDSDELSKNIKVLFLDRRLLRMADKYKNRKESLQQKKHISKI
jgi:hypothetical protein